LISAAQDARTFVAQGPRAQEQKVGFVVLSGLVNRLSPAQLAMPRRPLLSVHKSALFGNSNSSKLVDISRAAAWIKKFRIKLSEEDTDGFALRCLEVSEMTWILVKMMWIVSGG
jgi:hypothetical protein